MACTDHYSLAAGAAWYGLAAPHAWMLLQVTGLERVGGVGAEPDLPLWAHFT